MKTGTRPDIAVTTPKAKLRLSAQDVLADYRLAVRSRAASELSRREVLVGKAPFGISGEGKEIAQLGMAHAFRPGDWRSGYYRDQTFMFAVGLADLSQYFAQLYADPDVVRDPNSAGRQMLSHFATRTLDERGRFKDLLATGQSASELSPVAAQMPRSVGLAWASRLYRESPAARSVARGFSRGGEGVCFATSGSRERYKSRERLRFEIEFDPIRRMREWLIREEMADAASLDELERASRIDVERIREEAWEAYQAPIHAEREQALTVLEAAAAEDQAALEALVEELRTTDPPSRRLIASTARRALAALRGRAGSARDDLAAFAVSYAKHNDELFNSHLYSRSAESPLRIGSVAPAYRDDAEMVDGRMVLLRCFDANLERDPRILILGEDVGKLGDVNLVFEGLQAKHGEQRVIDTGIREATILGQGIGAALRGLRPVVDIQYVDYLLYALELASDDLATLHWRTAGGQKAPVLIRTKGHRLQGIWHTGSPMATIISSLRGLHVAVPRAMTRAAGLYNTLLRGDDPALLIEVLSGYRLKERLPDNVGEFTIPLGVTETIRNGSDVTVVTYGALCRIAMEAATDLARIGIEAEIVDVQTLLPFDRDHAIAESVQKTGALLVVDEDVPGGASAYIVREIVETQGAIDDLDVGPRTLTAAPNRVAVGNDGDYFSKPNREDMFEAVYAIMRERRPDDFPPITPERRG